MARFTSVHTAVHTAACGGLEHRVGSPCLAHEDAAMLIIHSTRPLAAERCQSWPICLRDIYNLIYAFWNIPTLYVRRFGSRFSTNSSHRRDVGPLLRLIGRGEQTTNMQKHVLETKRRDLERSWCEGDGVSKHALTRSEAYKRYHNPLFFPIVIHTSVNSAGPDIIELSYLF